jgi:hypothetical protein
VYDTVKPRTLIIDHGGQVSSIATLGSSGPNGIAIIILFPFFRRSCRTWRARPKGPDLVHGRRGTPGFPQFPTVALSLNKARSQICGRGSSIYLESLNSSPPRTKLDPCWFSVPEPVFRTSRMGVQRSNRELC